MSIAESAISRRIILEGLRVKRSGNFMNCFCTKITQTLFMQVC